MTIRRFRTEYADGHVEVGILASSDAELDAYLGGVPAPSGGRPSFGPVITEAVESIGRAELDRLPNMSRRVIAVSKRIVARGVPEDRLPSARTIREFLDRTA